MDAASLHCPDCGAAVEADALTCSYCGSHLQVRLCPGCFGLNTASNDHCAHCGRDLPKAASEPAPLPDGRPCPGCESGLHRTVLGETEVLECLECGGLWLGREAFERLGEEAETHRSLVAAEDLSERTAPPRVAVENPASVRYRKCPTCRAWMNRRAYGQISGIVLDECRAHGFWFDRDKLPEILRFIRTGGLERAAAFRRDRGPGALAPVDASGLPPLDADAARSPLAIHPEEMPREALAAFVKASHVAESTAKAGWRAFKTWYNA